jgi:hypothetical protein
MQYDTFFLRSLQLLILPVSIIGGFVKKNIFDESQKKYEFFLNHLLKYVRSSDSCLITDCSERGNYKNINL